MQILMAVPPGYSSICSKLDCIIWRLWGGGYPLLFCRKVSYERSSMVESELLSMIKYLLVWCLWKFFVTTKDLDLVKSFLISIILHTINRIVNIMTMIYYSINHVQNYHRPWFTIRLIMWKNCRLIKKERPRMYLSRHI